MKALHLAVAAPRPSLRRPSVWALLGRALALHRSRRGLAELDAHMLGDIGLSVEEAATEAARPVWDAPEHWQHRR